MQHRDTCSQQLTYTPVLAGTLTTKTVPSMNVHPPILQDPLLAEMRMQGYDPLNCPVTTWDSTYPYTLPTVLVNDHSNPYVLVSTTPDHYPAPLP